MRRAMMEKLDRMIILKLSIKANMKVNIKVILGSVNSDLNCWKTPGPERLCETVSVIDT